MFFHNFKRSITVILLIFATLSGITNGQFLGHRNKHNIGEISKDFPLGPIGGTYKIWRFQSFVRVDSLDPLAPGAQSGLKVNDYIYGAFNQDFDASLHEHRGCTQQLGDAIDRAEGANGILPLKVMRPGVGPMEIKVKLPVLKSLPPFYPLSSSKYAESYEAACSEIHRVTMATRNGYHNYPTPYAGLCLLAHPDWNKTTGSKPYLLSIQKIRDYFVNLCLDTPYAPVESKLLNYEFGADGKVAVAETSNPNYQGGADMWQLGPGLMFLSEYYGKTKDPEVFAALQRGVEVAANCVQYWKQPGVNENGWSNSYLNIRGQVGHGGVTGDYGGGGLNVCGGQLFAGMAMAKRTGVDMSVRPRDGHYFGYDTQKGDPNVPISILRSLPDSIDLPNDCQDPDTGATTIHDAIWYDMTVEQKFWLRWDRARRSTIDGYVNYFTANGGPDAAAQRTAPHAFGMLVYSEGGQNLSTENLEILNSQINHLVNHYHLQLAGHGLSMMGPTFNPLILPYLNTRQQRFYFDNWKFYYTLMRQPNNEIDYVVSRPSSDTYQDLHFVALVTMAMPRAVALGNFTYIPKFDTDQIHLKFKSPKLNWYKIDAHDLQLQLGENKAQFELELTDTYGNTINPADCIINWSVVSGPSQSVTFSNPGSLSTSATFPQTGKYRIKVEATHANLTTTEFVDVTAPLNLWPENWKPSIADCGMFDVDGVTVESMTNLPNYPDRPDREGVVYNLLTRNTQRTNLGVRIYGYISPPESGDYHFHISAAHAAELHFNPVAHTGDFEADKAGLQKIAHINSPTRKLQWTKSSSQKSEPITLRAGDIYRYEILWKKEGTPRHVFVAWTKPGSTEIEPIDKFYYAVPRTSGQDSAIVGQPEDQTIALGETIQLRLFTEGPQPALYQWRHNGVNIGSPSALNTLIIPNAGGALEGEYDCVYTTKNGTLISETASVSFTNTDYGELHTGGLWEETYRDVSGDHVSDLEASSVYPTHSSDSDVRTELDMDITRDNTGVRWTGWIIPPETTSYRFFVTSKTSHALRMSPTEFESHKYLIHSSDKVTDHKNWEDVTPSEWIPMEAGKRYYIEFLHKKGKGQAQAAITWQRLGDPDPVNGGPTIPSSNLEYRIGGYFSDPIDTAPILIDDEIRARKGTPQVVINALENDLDNEVSSLIFGSVTQPSNGSVTLNGTEFIYIPDPDFVGTDSFTYTAVNGKGMSSTNSATVNIIISSLPPGIHDFIENPIVSYGGSQDREGLAEAEDNGATIHLKGNVWKASPINYKVTEFTRMEFDFRSPVRGEEHAIGLDTDLGLSNSRFVLYGSANSLSIPTYRNYPGGNATIHYDIPIGIHLQPGYYNYLTFTNDHDVNNPGGESFYSNIRLYEVDASFANWQQLNFSPAELIDENVSGGNADYDNDGIQNFLEYALHLDPKKVDQLPQMELLEFNGDFGFLVDFPHYPGRKDVNLKLQYSKSLGEQGWKTIARSLGGAPVDFLNGGSLLSTTGSDPAILKVRTPNTRGERAFIRWKAISR